MLRYFIALMLLFTPAFADEGENITLIAKPAFVITGQTTSAKLFDELKSRQTQFEAMSKEKGEMIAKFTAKDDGEFTLTTYYTSTQPLKDVTPEGARLKFTHKGAYDLIDQTYEDIADILDAKGITANEEVEETFTQDLKTTPENELVVVITLRLKTK
jgi:hypothetical protein